jgi:two-component system, sensor histidine kinase and response regulator
LAIISLLIFSLIMPLAIAGLWIDKLRRDNASRGADLAPISRQSVIDSLDTAAIILDLQGKIVAINAAAARQFLINESQVHRKPVTAIFAWWKDVEQCIGDCIDLQKDIQPTVRDKKYQYNVQITPIWDDHQNLNGRLVLIRDISVERAAEGAQSLASVRAEFLAKVSHELRTPLTSILGISEMLDYGVYGPLSHEQKEALRLIADSSQHMVRLVNDLLEQTRLERGALELDIAEFVMEDLVNRLRVNTIQVARSKGLSLTFEIARDVPSILRGDALRLYQILRNLVDNAIKYTEKGQVKLRIYQLSHEVESGSLARHFAFEVSDTGIGIPKDKQTLIYEPFLRVYPPNNMKGNGKANGNGNGNGSSAPKTSGLGASKPNGSVEGFGLGLSIVRQLVSLMDGEIELESDSGQGSTFTIKLQLEPASEPLPVSK